MKPALALVALALLAGCANPWADERPDHAATLAAGWLFAGPEAPGPVL